MIIRNKKVFAYDIEVFPNVFTCTIIDSENNKCAQLEISNRKNNLPKIKKLFHTVFQDLKSWDNKIDLGTNRLFVGYNNLHYDNPIINFIIDSYELLQNQTPFEICQSIFNLSNEIISSEDINASWKKYKYMTKFESFDLLTMLFSSKLRVGLKEMEVTMNMPNVHEFEGDFNKYLPDDKIDNCLIYNKHDVEATIELLNRCKDAIDLRIGIENEYKIPALSKDGMNIGVEIIKNKYLQATGKKWSEVKDLRSPCDNIVLKNVIFDNIHFESPILQNLLTEMKSLTVSAGRKGYEKHFLLDDLEISVGVGGIHSINKPEQIIPNENEVLLDSDVALA